MSAGPFEKNKAAAYQGATGRLREQFSLDYIDHKRKIISLMEQSLQNQVDESGETISCAKGCAVCCSSYIVASLQECEAVVYWLYQHPEVMSDFLKSYEGWHAGIDKIAPVFHEIAAFGDTGGQPGPEAQKSFEAAMRRYRAAMVFCPFLKEGACSIYEVRPWACAGVVSVSPREWCDPAHPHFDQLKLYRWDTYVMFERPFYVPTKQVVHLGCLPEMVYRILAEGFSALTQMTGFEMTHS